MRTYVHLKYITNLRRLLLFIFPCYFNSYYLFVIFSAISVFGSLKILLNLNIQTSKVVISPNYINIYSNLSGIISLMFKDKLWFINSISIFAWNGSSIEMRNVNVWNSLLLICWSVLKITCGYDNSSWEIILKLMCY